MIMKYTFAKNNTDRGFTLLETLVAIAVLVLAITATFTAAQSGLSSSIEARDQIKAFYLAQEGIEMVRNLRDQNSLQRVGAPSTSWLTGLAAQVSDPCYFGKSCMVDATKDPLTAFTTCSSPSNCDNIREDLTSNSSTYGMYGYNPGWSQTNFNREIDLSQGTSTEVLVSVTMKWTRALLTRTFKVSEIIRDWQ